jgi:adenylate cyclase
MRLRRFSPGRPFMPARSRLFVWILLTGMVLSAVYGHFDPLSKNGGGTGYVRGAVTGAIISSVLASLEIFVFAGPRGALFRRVPFRVYLAARVLIYLVVTLLGLLAGQWLVPDAAGISIRRSDLVFSAILSVGFNLFLGVNRLLGQNVLFNFAAGRYNRPRIEERVLLFIDMESSTAIAETLGEIAFVNFLNRFVGDITDPIVKQRGEIHKYVGDEVIVTWPLADGIERARCIQACFDALRLLAMRGADYERDFGRRAHFRAALHCGPVVIGELGSVKMEIALLGDTMNTAARIQQACRDTSHPVLASAALIARIAALPPGIVKRSLGPMRLRGKGTELELYALEAPAKQQASTMSHPAPPKLAPATASDPQG